MKRTLLAILIAVLAFSACGCSVHGQLDTGSGSSVLFFGYTSDGTDLDLLSDGDANLILITERLTQTGLKNLFAAAAEDKFSVSLDVTDYFFNSDGSLKSGWQRSNSGRFYEMSRAKRKIHSFCFSEIIGLGVSSADFSTAVTYLKTNFPDADICIRTADITNYSDEYLSLCDAIFCAFDGTPDASVYSSFTAADKDTYILINGNDDRTLTRALKTAYAFNTAGIICGSVSNKNGDHLLAAAATISSIILKNNAVDEIIFVPTVRYNGIYHTDGYAGSESYVAEVAAMGLYNIAILELYGSPSELAERIELFVSEGLMPIIAAGRFFDYSWNEGTYTFDSAAFASYIPVLNEYSDDIYALYFDEPKWNNIPESIFRECTSAMRTACPDIGVMAVLALPSLSADSASYFEFCTDIGYDTYSVWDDATRENQLRALHETAAFGQKLWLVPCTCTISYTDENRFIADINGCYALAEADDDIVGLLSFTYLSSDDGIWATGDWGNGFRYLISDSNPNNTGALLQAHTTVAEKILAADDFFNNQIKH